MKPASETITSNDLIPLAFKKNSTSSQLNFANTLSPTISPEEKLLNFDEGISNIKSFKKFLLNYYKTNAIGEGIYESALNQIEFLYDLFKIVNKSGG